MSSLTGYLICVYMGMALLCHAAFAQDTSNTLLQDNRHYTYLYWENGYPTRETGRRPQSWANQYARDNAILVVQTGYYSLALDCNKIKLTGYDALDGSDYVSALHEDVTQFTPASLTLKAYQNGIEYTATSGIVQNGNESPVRLIESGQFLQRYDDYGLVFTAADGTQLNVPGRLEISAWPEQLVFKLDFSNQEGSAVDIDRTVIQLTSPAGKHYSSDVNGISATLGVRPHEDLEAAPLNPTAIVNKAVDLQTNKSLTTQFDTATQALKVNLPIADVRYPDHINRVDEFLLEVTNPTENPLDIPLVFEENVPRAITGTVMLLSDETDGKPIGIPVQVSKNWHINGDTGIKAIHRGRWLRGSTYFTLAAGETRRFKLKVVFGYWAGVGAASHSQLSLIGWGGNWKWDESALGAWGESMTYDPTQHLGSAFMGDIRPAFTPSMANGGRHNWTENVGGGDFLVYFDANNQYRWGKRLKTAYVWTGPNMTQVMYSGVTDDNRIRFDYTSRLVSTNDYQRRLHDYRYEFLQDVTSPKRLVFYQMAADWYTGPAFDTFYVGDETGLLEQLSSNPGGNTYKGSFNFANRWLAIDDLTAAGSTAAGSTPTPKANRGIIQRSSTLNGQDFPVFMHQYGRTWGSNRMFFDLAGESVSRSFRAGDVVEGEFEFILPPKQASNYWGSDDEFRNRLTAYTTPWQAVFDEYRYNNKMQVTVHSGTLLKNFPVEVAAVHNGSSAIIADLTIQSGGLGHVPIVVKDATIGKSLKVERYLDGAWVALDIDAATSNSYYQGYQNSRRKIDYAFSIKRPVADLTSSWRIRVSYDAAPVVPSTNLEEDASQWGGYAEGNPGWVIENTTAHSPAGKALRCGLTGGDPYSNIHCYRNLPADPDAKYFSLSLNFFMPETSFNNQGSPSKVQALEFTMNQWQDEKRHEWALQWMNVGSGGPQWRYWDANKPDAERWVSLNIQQELAINSWHKLRLEGEIRGGKVYYRYFIINDQRHELDIAVEPFNTPGNPDLLAVAVQADGNHAETPYDLLIDNVNFYHTPDRRLDAAPTGSHFHMVGNRIFDPQGNLFVPKGVNIFPWQGDADSIERIAGCWNFNTVRLHAWILPDTTTDQWKDHIVYLDQPLIFDPTNSGGLRTYDIRALIEAYTARGIVVLFDVHDLLGKYFEGTHLEDYTTFITDFARKFKDNPYVWIDLHNEPGTYQGVGNADQGIPAHDFSRWQAEYAAMRAAVRSIAPNMPIFASGNAWGQDTGPNWNGDQPVASEASALLSNADFFAADPQLGGTIHVYDQWNYGADPAARLQDYFDRVQATTRSPLLIGEFGYADNTGKATEALHTLLQRPQYQHIGRLVWTWAASDNNDLTTDATSQGSGAAIDACHAHPSNLTRLGELVWQDTHAAELDSDNDGLPNQQDEDDDNDGLPDLWELENGLDSSNAADAVADNDSDGLINLDEYRLDTDPLNPDSDGDGLKDGEEVNTHNTNPLNQDSDGDGMNDKAEIDAGRDPNDPADASANNPAVRVMPIIMQLLLE
ncbi:MAG: cellulase family glycosylhydrolase [Candidatus Thiothrix sulfatifontis]|nr:MAG: cellulase family glycosylhydrolase [Candidatus Thiothrix sulfatifontis]